MADIAAIFHWPLSELEQLELGDLIEWHGRAAERWKRMHPPPR